MIVVRVGVLIDRSEHERVLESAAGGRPAVQHTSWMRRPPGMWAAVHRP